MEGTKKERNTKIEKELKGLEDGQRNVLFKLFIGSLFFNGFFYLFINSVHPISQANDRSHISVRELDTFPCIRTATNTNEGVCGLRRQCFIPFALLFVSSFLNTSEVQENPLSQDVIVLESRLYFVLWLPHPHVCLCERVVAQRISLQWTPPHAISQMQVHCTD